VSITSSTKEDEIIKLFRNNIKDFDPSKRYVAIHDQTGDCVIYENGTIDRVSDSG
jgi:hypothetical protein